MCVTAGHPQEASGEGSDRAAVPDRGPLHPEEERRGGARRSRQQDRKSCEESRIDQSNALARQTINNSCVCGHECAGEASRREGRAAEDPH